MFLSLSRTLLMRSTRFKSVYKEYIKAKDVTKRRIYLESMLEIFPKLGAKYVIDSDQKNILPFLNMGKENPILNPKD